MPAFFSTVRKTREDIDAEIVAGGRQNAREVRYSDEMTEIEWTKMIESGLGKEEWLRRREERRKKKRDKEKRRLSKMEEDDEDEEDEEEEEEDGEGEEYEGEKKKGKKGGKKVGAGKKGKKPKTPVPRRKSGGFPEKRKGLCFLSC